MRSEPPLKLLPLYLEPDLYEGLDRQARDNDREATQQARHLIRLAVRVHAGDGRQSAETES